MNELTNWIDKHVDDISDSQLFKRYFSDLELDLIDDQYFLENLSKGIDVIFTEKMVVRSIHLYSNNYQNAKAFKEKLPQGLFFSDERIDIHKKIGEPDTYGGGYDDNIFGFIEYWEKYYFPNYSLHLRYSPNQHNIVLITIATLNFEKNIAPD